MVAATKMNDADRVRAAVEAGVDVCGENRVQELLEKYEQHAYDGKPLHFIGTLQSNKVKYLIGKVAMIESVSSVKLAKVIDKEAAKAGICQDILLEVNIGDEESKGGAAIDEILALAQHALSCPHLNLRGIMCIPPATASDEENRAFFRETYQLFVDMKEKLGDNNSNIDCLSMGMSGDFENAIREGATLVRIGTAIYGERDYSKKV